MPDDLDSRRNTSWSRRLLVGFANLATLAVMAVGAPPFVYILGTSLDGRRSSVLFAFLAESAIAVAVIAPPILRGFPRFLREPLLARSRALRVATGILGATFLFFFGQAVAPRFLPEIGTEGLRIDPIGPPGEAYGLAWMPELDRLLVTQTHNPRGLGYVIVDVASGGVLAQAPWSAENYKPATVVPRLGLAVVPETFTEDGPPAITHFVDMRSFAEWNRPANDRVVFRSTYDPRIDRLYVIDKANQRLWKMSPEELLAGSFDQAPTWDLDAILAFEEVELHPLDPDKIYLRGDNSTRVEELDVVTGARRAVRIPQGAWDLSVDPGRNLLFASRPYGGMVSAVDIGRFEIERSAFVGGVPRLVAYLPDLDVLAVGLFKGGKLLLLDPSTLETRTRLRTCSQVRDLFFDSGRRALFFSDGCGIHRITFPPGWETASSRNGD